MIPALTPIGTAFVLAIIVGLLVRRNLLPYLLAVAVALPHTAAIVVGDSSLTPFYLVAIACAAHLFVMQVRESPWVGDLSRTGRATLVALLVLVGYGVVVSLIGPIVFAGMPVFAPRGGIDEQVGNLSALSFGVSNIAQPAYLVLGVMVAIYLGRITSRARLIELSFAVGVGLALVRLVAPALWPTGLFENAPNVRYAVTQIGLRGTFGEPSVFGLFLVAGLVYAGVAFAVAADRRRRGILGAAIVVMLIELAFNASWTAFATLGIAVLAAAVVGAIRLVRVSADRPRRQHVLLGVYGVVLVGVLAALPFALALIGPKLESASAVNRAASNAAATRIFVDSFSIGVGLGSNRPSSLLFLLLSCVGIVGTLAFVAAVVFMIAGTWRVRSLWAVGASLAITVVGQMISVPELSLPLLWMLAGLTLFSARASAIERRSVSAQPAPFAAG